MRSFIAAIQFLTVCPFVGGIRCTEREIGRGALYFPLVGLLLGTAIVLIDRIASSLFPPLLASATTIVALIGFSGGLHMDGLGDTADGFFSSRPRHRILEIMKDSHVGAMAVIATVCLIALKITALASIPAQFRLSVLFLMPLAGRCALVAHLAVLNYARPEGGLATVFTQNRKKSDAVVALAVLGVAGWSAGGQWGLMAAGFAILGTVLFSLWSHRKIGGFTGDTLGACCEIAELIPALVGAACLCSKGGL